jgi:hypothetical protein
MSDKPRRLVAADIIGQQHEAVMAALNRSAQSASETTEYGQHAVGDKSGQAYLKSLVVVREDGEGWAAYQGRKETALIAELEMLAKVNAEKLQRDLQASVR